MSLDYVSLHRLCSDLSLRPLSRAEHAVVEELLGGGVHVRDRSTLDACNRLADLELAVQHVEDSFSAAPLLLDLKRASLLGKLGID